MAFTLPREQWLNPPWRDDFCMQIEGTGGLKDYHCHFRRPECLRRHGSCTGTNNGPFNQYPWEPKPTRCDQCVMQKDIDGDWPDNRSDFDAAYHYLYSTYKNGEVCAPCKAVDDAVARRQWSRPRHHGDRKDKGGGKRDKKKDRKNSYKPWSQYEPGAFCTRPCGEDTQHGGQTQTNSVASEQKRSGVFSVSSTKQKETRPLSHASPRPTPNTSNMAFRPRQIPQSPPKATQKPPLSWQAIRGAEKPKGTESLQGAKKTGGSLSKMFTSKPAQESKGLPIPPKKKS